MQKPLLQRIHVVALAAAAGAVSTGAPAADSPASTLSQVLASSGITESGYVAASYYHSSGYNTYHQFDTSHDTFQLDQAALQLAYQPKSGFGAVLDVIAGEDAKIVDAAESAGASDHAFDILQGFAQYVAGPLTVQAGKFTTLAGAEVIAPAGNTNFSRSLLFFGEPLTHTGMRATYAITDAVSVMAGINNGWNYTKINYGSKTGELGIALTPNKLFSLTAQVYAGKDPVYAAQRTLIDTVATFNVTAALSFVVSYDWGKQETGPATPAGLTGGDWEGLAGYVNYQLNSEWRLSVRAEYLDDKDGTTLLTGTRQGLKEGTITLGYDPVASFELRLEGRYDTSSESTLLESITPVALFRDDQTEVAVQGVYKF
ncbi:MAG TPA: outer membrane beta-barrel protein [Steroidobacteraceae bacterium]|nr:outer membrane beta-barrel protein [Steroidobacteraceae bacterium]